MDVRRTISVPIQSIRLHVRNNWKKLLFLFILSFLACVYLGSSLAKDSQSLISDNASIAMVVSKSISNRKNFFQTLTFNKQGQGHEAGTVPVLPDDGDHLVSIQASMEDDLGAFQFQAPSKRCKFPIKPKVKPRDAVFQYFELRDIYVYSAYLDLRGYTREIRVIGIAPFDPERFNCQLTYTDGAVVSVPAVAVDMQMRKREEQRGFRYVAHFFLCKEPMDAIPVSVSLTAKSCTMTPSNAIKIYVRGTVEETRVPNRLLVCVKLLYNFKLPYKLAEFIEYQRIMQADKVVLYDLDEPSDDVRDMVDYYVDEGVVRMQPWKLPVKTSMTPDKGGQIRLYGQHAQVQDCIYRFMDSHRHILIVDTDEFIIPHAPGLSAYPDLMRHVQSLEPAGQLSSSYVFANAHFCLSNKEMVRSMPQLLLVNIVRRNEVESFKHRCKSIINPRRVVEMGVHFVHQPRPGSPRFQHVPPSIAFMHHYRKSKLGSCEYLDKEAQKFRNQLLYRVNKVCDAIGIARVKS